jgi:glycosyltransferase involved in cell wall biosynthesis
METSEATGVGGGVGPERVAGVSAPGALRIALSNASPAWGGVHTVTEHLARGLQARGHEVALLCRPRSPLEERMRGIVRCEPVLNGMDLSPPALWRCGRVLRRLRPDVVVTLTKKDVRLSAPAARALGILVVVRHANDQPVRGGAFGRLLYGAVPALHVTNAEATRRTILASAPWIPPERVAVVPNGVDQAAFEAAVPADLGLPPGAVAVAFVGSFEPRKGLPDLAAAWPAVADSVPAAHLVLVGKGSQDALLRERLADAHRVSFLGHRADVHRVMRAIDVLVLPSHAEGAPNVVLEAMAAGKAVVATAVSGTPELVEDGRTGLLVPPRQPAALSRALIRVAGDALLRERMGREGSARARREYPLARMLDRFEEILRDLAAGRAAAR